MGFFKDIKIFFQKRFLYKPDAEMVDIRLESIPDWIYKVTIKGSVDFKQASKQNLLELKSILDEVKIQLDVISSKKIIFKDVSRFEKEKLEKKTIEFIDLLKSFITLVDKELNTIEDYRLFFNEFSRSFIEVDSKIKSNFKLLETNYDKELSAISDLFSKVNAVLIKCSDLFKQTSDPKIKTIVNSVKEIQLKSLDRVKIDDKIILLDRDLKKIRAQVYKLNDKLDLLRKSPRFKDVLDKEGRLGKLLEDKDDVMIYMEKKFNQIKLPFTLYAEKVRQKDLAKEYLEHFPQAIQHDSNLDILNLLEGLNKDLNNKRTKIWKSLGNLNAEEKSIIVQEIISGLKPSIVKVAELDKQIKNIRSSMRSYIIFNEIEDIESRVEFYQGKLKQLLKQRRNLIIKIEKLDLLGKKDKLRKDLLLVTGYDVNVIYDAQD